PPRSVAVAVTDGEDACAPAPIETEGERLRSEPLAEATGAEGPPSLQPAAFTEHPPDARPSSDLQGGASPSARRSQDAPGQLLLGSSGLVKTSTGRETREKTKEAYPVGLHLLRIRNISRSQWMVRGAVSSVIFLLLGGVAIN